MKAALRSSHALLRHLGVDPSLADDSQDFPTLVPPAFAARMRQCDPGDPLLRQVLARAEENVQHPDFVADPLSEADSASTFHKAPGLLQKYRSRVLLITNSACAIHCRYCFRRHFPYADHREHHHQKALAAIAADATVQEVILSGGDPLMLDDEALQALVTEIDRIDHVRRLRIHTRMPIVLPQRVTGPLVDTLAETRLAVVVVVHVNHANELDDETRRALACLSIHARAHLLNQAVLLQGINDSLRAQIDLSHGLFDQGVLPYYLHLPDAVAGTTHFHVPCERAKALYEELRGHLSGYLLPKLVQEVPGESSKLIVSG